MLEVKVQFNDDLFFKVKEYVKNNEKSIIPPQLLNQVKKLESYIKNFQEKIGNFNEEKILELFKKYQTTLTASQYYFLKFALRDYENWLRKSHLKLLEITEKNAKSYENWLRKIKSDGTVKDRLLRLFALYEFFISEEIILTNPFKKVISTSRQRSSLRRHYDTKTEYHLTPSLCV